MKANACRLHDLSYVAAIVGKKMQKTTLPFLWGIAFVAKCGPAISIAMSSIHKRRGVFPTYPRSNISFKESSGLHYLMYRECGLQWLFLGATRRQHVSK